MRPQHRFGKHMIGFGLVVGVVGSVVFVGRSENHAIQVYTVTAL